MQNILIIDDNRMILHSLSSFLRLELKGFEVLTAEDGERAIQLLETTPVSLILTDLEMPRVDGYQVIEYAKKNLPRVPVIIMTGSWSLDLELLVKKTGIVRCIEKPFRYEYLVDMAKEALGENRESTQTILPARRADGTCC